jgi:hypothetical protein
MECCNVCGTCPAPDTDLISAETETDEKQYSGSVKGPHTAPSSGAGRRKDATSAILMADLNRPVALDSGLPLFPCYAIEKSRLCLLLRPTWPCFQIVWRLFFCRYGWDCMANDRFVLLQGLTAGGANDKMLL